MSNQKLDAHSFITEAIADIKNKVGQQKAVNLLSGGVDSAVVNVLAERALGDNLISVFFDTGLMREDEAKKIKAIFPKVIIIEAQNIFIKALEGKIDPDLEKRPAVSDTFYQLTGKLIKQYGAIFLFQGTSAADTKETAKYKWVFQHNVRPLEEFAQFGIKNIVEPVGSLFKDQIREVARALCLPPEICERMPFPGPGLSLRIIGEVTKEKLEIIRKATVIVEDELKHTGAFQYFPILTDTKARGIKEEKRVYDHVMAVRCVDSKDAGVATVTPLPYDLLEKITLRLTKEVPTIARVVYDITPKYDKEGPGSIEWE